MYFFLHIDSVPLIALSFVIAGLVNGMQDSLEGSATASLATETQRGLGFGLLGATNGVGDLLSSVIVGALCTVYPTLGFGYAAFMMVIGAIMMHRSAVE